MAFIGQRYTLHPLFGKGKDKGAAGNSELSYRVIAGGISCSHRLVLFQPGLEAVLRHSPIGGSSGPTNTVRCERRGLCVCERERQRERGM